MVITSRIKSCAKCLLVCISLCLIFSGCDVYYGKRPMDYEDTIWICDDPYMRIIAGKWTHSEYIGKGEDKYQVYMTFRYDATLYCFSSQDFSQDSLLFIGDCTFSEREMIMRFTEDNLFHEQYDVVTFTRYENDYSVPSIEFEP